MNTKKIGICCRNEYTQQEIDVWTTHTFITGRPASDKLSTHVAQCPACLHRAAIAWSLFSDPVDPSLPIPAPDLGFLQTQV